MAKGKKQDTGDEKKAGASANPYLNARREWDERYGDVLSRAHSWKMAAFGAIGVAVIAVLGVSYIGSKSKIEPYVVAINKIGDPIGMAEPVSGGPIDQRIIEAQVTNWVWLWRTMLDDPQAQKAILAKVYAMASTQAAAQIDPWYKKVWARDAGDVVSPHITSVLPVSKHVYQVTWQEAIYKDGQRQGAPQMYKANITVGRDKKLANSAQASMLNPLGIYIKSLTWTHVYQNS